VTKGYHFPDLTLVGVVDADMGLEGGDLRAAERTYQQVAQVAGRAGRGEKPGEVLIQTRHPDAPVIAALASGDATPSTPPKPKPGAKPMPAVRALGRDHRVERGRGRSARRGPRHRRHRAAPAR
jgi:hypothetical protein